MINLEKIGSGAIKFTFTDSDHYLVGNGQIEVPVNSLSLVVDNSGMVTFNKSATNDTFVSFRPENSNLGTASAVENFFKENMVSDGGGGGTSSGVTSGQVESMISEALEDYPTNDDLEDALDDVYTKDEVDSGFSSVTSSVTAVNASLTAHTADTTIHVTSADKTAWNNKSNFSGDYNDLTNKPTIPVVPTSNTAFTNDAGYITEADIADKADTSAITGFFGAVAYNSNDKKIYFYHENTGETALAYVDATDFIKDGMVDNVEIKTLSGASYLAITFNSDAGKEEIDIPIADIFDASNYYNKTETDTLLAAKLDATAYTPTDLSQYWTSAQTSAAINEATSGKANASDVTAALANKQDISGMTAYVSHAEFDPKEEVISTALNDLNDRVEDLETGGSSVVIASAITSSSTNSEAAGALATYNAITAATTGGGATYSAGTNISIDTANTINCTLPITATTNNNYLSLFFGEPSKTGSQDNILIGKTDLFKTNGQSNVVIGNGAKSSTDNVVIGRNATGGSLNNYDYYNVAIGSLANAKGGNHVALGYGVSATGTTQTNINNQIKVDTNNQVYIKDKTNTTEICLQDYLGGGISSGQVQDMIEDYFDPKEEVIATSLVDLNGRVEDLETGGTGISSGQVQSMIDGSISGKADTSAVTTINDALTAHTNNAGIHTTAQEKAAWDAKANMVTLTQAEYDAMVTAGTVDSGTCYVISDATSFDPSTKQDVLSAGTGIDITNNVISVTGGGGSSVTIATAITSSSTNDDAAGALATYQTVSAHTANTTVHVTQADKNVWNNAAFEASSAYSQLNGITLVRITQSEYDDLVNNDEVDPDTFYIIVSNN